MCSLWAQPQPGSGVRQLPLRAFGTSETFKVMKTQECWGTEVAQQRLRGCDDARQWMCWVGSWSPGRTSAE